MPPLTRAPSPPKPGPAWRSVIGGLLAATVLVAGCAKKASPGTEAPADAAGGQAGEPAAFEHGPLGQDLAGYERELEGYEDQLLSSGVELPGAVAQARADQGQAHEPAADGGGSPAGARCERICQLAANVCELRERICDLASEHPTEPRYAQVCERATLDCERATEVCEGCNG